MSKGKIISIALPHDNNYTIPCAVTINSILCNCNKEFSYFFYILHQDITEENQSRLIEEIKKYPNADIRFITIPSEINSYQGCIGDSHYSVETFAKLFLASLLPDLDRVIVSDVDVVFLGDISESYFIFDNGDDVNKFYFAGVRPVDRILTYYDNYKENFSKNEIAALSTIGGGYLVANLKKIRSDNIEARFLERLKRDANRILQAEQDIINLVCAGKIKFLPLNNLVCTYLYDLYDKNSLVDEEHYTAKELMNAMANPIQLHYATAIKPWNTPYCTKSEIWVEYLQKTGFIEEALQKFCKTNFFSPPAIEALTNYDEKPYEHTVSVICLTYNHEKFIRKTLEGLVSQQVNFNYEVLVADDASTDRTRLIVEEFHQSYPNIIKPIFNSKNIGAGKNAYNTLCKASGKYLAFCDGDDLWIDDKKLQTQVDFLEQNLEYNICCSNVKVYHFDENKEDEDIQVVNYLPEERRGSAYFEFSDLLYYRFIACCTCMVRWKMKDRVPFWLAEHVVVDFPVFLIHAAFGKIKVFDNFFAQYTVHSNGVSRKHLTPRYKKKMDSILQHVDDYTCGFKKDEFQEYRLFLAKLAGNENSARILIPISSFTLLKELIRRARRKKSTELIRIIIKKIIRKLKK